MRPAAGPLAISESHKALVIRNEAGNRSAEKHEGATPRTRSVTIAAPKAR
jgi:hypothetical protein